MSFDIFLSTCNLGTRKKRVKNPVTGKFMMVPDDLGLNEIERAGVLHLLRQMKAEGPNDFGAWNIAFADGGEADLNAKELADGTKCNGCSLETRNLTADVARFVFKLSRVGNMLIYFPMPEGDAEFVTTAEQKQKIVARYPDAKVIRSAAALEKKLQSGFHGWESYREQVMSDE